MIDEIEEGIRAAAVRVLRRRAQRQRDRAASWTIIGANGVRIVAGEGRIASGSPQRSTRPPTSSSGGAAVTADLHALARELNGKPAGSGFICSCPLPTHGKGRGDKHPSLSIAASSDGSLLLHCKAGCDSRDIFSALRARGLIDERPGRRDRQSSRSVRSPISLPTPSSPTGAPLSLALVNSRRRLAATEEVFQVALDQAPNPADAPLHPRVRIHAARLVSDDDRGCAGGRSKGYRSPNHLSPSERNAQSARRQPAQDDRSDGSRGDPPRSRRPRRRARRRHRIGALGHGTLRDPSLGDARPKGSD